MFLIRGDHKNLNASNQIVSVQLEPGFLGSCPGDALSSGLPTIQTLATAVRRRYPVGSTLRLSSGVPHFNQLHAPRTLLTCPTVGKPDGQNHIASETRFGTTPPIDGRLLDPG